MDRGAKLIESIPRTPWYFSTYIYECVDCGAKYTQHRCGPDISPYCGLCQKEHDYHKQLMRKRAREKKEINELLELVKMSVNQTIDTYKLK